MSTRRTKKTAPRKDWRSVELTPKGRQALGQPSTVTAPQILAALVRSTEWPEMVTHLLAEAESRLPELTSHPHGFNPCTVRDVAVEMCNTIPDYPVWRTAYAAYRPVEEDAGMMEHVCTVLYSTAGASFLLGLVAGMKLGGAR